MMETRLICDGPADGVWNMAVDEALLETVGDGPTSNTARVGMPAAVLRFYRWSPATLSLGYFQGASERAGHAASRDCPWVRRASGGGAILHDHELTYSFATAVANGLGGHETLYDAFHDTLVETLAAWGVRASRVPATPPAESGTTQSGTTLTRITVAEMAPAGIDRAWKGVVAENTVRLASAAAVSVAVSAAAPAAAPVAGVSSISPSMGGANESAFLCFERRSPGDVLVAGMKVGGSAQRRNRGALLQHGSVLLRCSSFAPELPGIAELTGASLDPDVLRARWCERLAERLGLRWRPDGVTESERLRAAAIGREKFGSAAWMARRP